MASYNSFQNKQRFNDSVCESSYKYVITDAMVEGKKIDVQVIGGENVSQVDNKKVDLYINGVNVESKTSINGIGLEYLGVHDNMLFTHLDGGSYVTGYTQILAFDKNGKVKYSLRDNQSVVATNIISRPSVKILDGTITFSTHVDTSPSPTTTNYVITVSKIKSTMGNCGSISIPEFHEKARLTLVSNISIKEGSAHDVILKEIENNN